MARIIDLPTFTDERGSLTILEKVLPFIVKRLYYIYGATEKRGGHRHKNTDQALICVNGSCEVYINNGISESTYVLDSPEKCLFVDKADWHTMDKFSKDSVLLCLASHHYDVDDYIDDEY